MCKSLKKDVDLINGVQKLRQQLATLLKNIDNTVTVTGQEAMQQSNEVYANVKLAAKKDSKYKILAEELGEFYKKSKKNTTKSV
jgi:D-ribose pyranose/furanose isomerase RbsD